MSKIIKLDKNLANQIAAGEVVERPVSVVKELIENSIDANATNIKVEIENGGIDKIIISDDGEGIEKDDLSLVFEKYSTSKIKSLEDLYNVMTFGFRGEAMSSISSVCDIEIITKSILEKTSNKIKLIAGDISEIKQTAGENGTKIIVENLFYNTPARLNYLKKPRTEYSHINTYMQQIALSYPNIGFEFISDNKEIFKYKSAEDLKTRIYNVYGFDFAENILELNFSMQGINITGYISDPKVTFPNKNRQSLFVNKRIINSYLISRAINDAYNRFIPHGMNSAYVLNIQIDPTQVDVNVHPRKLEVRFANEQNIFRAVYHSVLEKLEKVSLINSNITLSQTFPQREKGVEQNATSSLPGGRIERGISGGYTCSGTKFKAYSPYTDKSANKNQTQINNALDFSKTLLQNYSNPISSDKNLENFGFEKSLDLHDTPLGKIIGQSHNSYIIIENSNGIQFLDQHALAERVIYEKLVNSDYINTTQGLLIAESLSLSSKEINILEENKDTFIQMGFDFEIMGSNIVIINGIPDFIKKEKIKDIFLGIIEDIGEYNFSKSVTLEEVKNKIFAYTACRSAIKFGHKLSLFEMNKLLNDSVLEYSSTCPHGRPVVFEINLNDLKNKYER